MLKIENNQHLLDSIPGAIGFKDLQSRYVAVNKTLARLMGFKHPAEVVGCADKDIKNEMAELATQFVTQDAEVLNDGEQQHIDIGCYDNNHTEIHFSHKKRWYDKDNKLAGTVFQCLELGVERVTKLYQFLAYNGKPAFYEIGGRYVDYQLSIRESECLFYLLRGFTAKGIAKMLTLSPKTIEYYIEQLKIKLKCNNKVELIEKAIHLGFVINIPLGIFPGDIPR